MTDSQINVDVQRNSFIITPLTYLLTYLLTWCDWRIYGGWQCWRLQCWRLQLPDEELPYNGTN